MEENFNTTIRRKFGARRKIPASMDIRRDPSRPAPIRRFLAFLRSDVARVVRAMQRFRPDTVVAAQHFPIIVAGYEGDLFIGEASFEEAACAFMTQIVEMKILHRHLYASATESGAN